MGNFDSVIISAGLQRSPRSVLKSDVGPKAMNAPQDIHIIVRTLSSAGLLHEKSPPKLMHNAIFRAIHHAQVTLGQDKPAHNDMGSTIQPGDVTERAVRHAVAKGRLALSHRAICESTAPVAPRVILSGGMRRALAKLDAHQTVQALSSPLSRALLPMVSMQTFQTNRRLAEALAEGGKIPGLEKLIAATIKDGGKQGFSDVRDIMKVLQALNSTLADDLFKAVQCCLDGKALRRFRKLYFAQPPLEGDFN